MIKETIELLTADGPCRVLLQRRLNHAPLPAVVLLHDGFGPREAISQMASRVASNGYVVALPDLFHRVGEVLDLTPPGTAREVKALIPVVMGTPELRARWRERYFASGTKPENILTTLGALFDFLATRNDVRQGPLGVSGYCMGGAVALRAAALFPERVAVAAAFHGGNLATDEPDSPHLGAPAMRARVYVARAIEDAFFTDEMLARLEQAFTAAGVAHEITTYPARHGFCIPDAPTYDVAAAERHYAALGALLSATFEG